MKLARSPEYKANKRRKYLKPNQEDAKRSFHLNLLGVQIVNGFDNIALQGQHNF